MVGVITYRDKDTRITPNKTEATAVEREQYL